MQLISLLECALKVDAFQLQITSGQKSSEKKKYFHLHLVFAAPGQKVCKRGPDLNLALLIYKSRTLSLLTQDTDGRYDVCQIFHIFLGSDLARSFELLC